MELAHEFTVDTPVDRAWAVLTDVERIAPCLPGAPLTEVDGDTYHGTVKVKVGPVVAQYGGTARFVEKDDVAHKAVLEAKGKEKTGRGLANAMVTAQLVGQGESTHVTVTTDLTISGPLAQFGRGAIAEVSTKLLNQFVTNLRETVLDAPDAPDPAPASDSGSGAGAEAPPPAASAAPSESSTAPAPSVGTPAQPSPAPSVSPAAPAAPGPPAAPAASAPADPQSGASSAESAPSSTRRIIHGPEAAPVDMMAVARGSILKRLIPLVVVVVVVIVLLVWLL
jgi:carbon monoxide dehydrogenase subunit G